MAQSIWFVEQTNGVIFLVSVILDPRIISGIQKRSILRISPCRTALLKGGLFLPGQKQEVHGCIESNIGFTGVLEFVAYLRRDRIGTFM